MSEPTTSTASAPKTVRVRFAPSPTGFLHIGGVRTALFNWLYARHFGGQFLLRIEDTDLERSEARFTQDIMASMKWLGLDWDEEPIFQSKRLEVYRHKAEELIAQGLAYRCDCSEADVEKMRETAKAKGARPQYDRTCRDKPAGRLAAGQPHVIRLKVPLEGHVQIHDLIRGEIRVENTEIDDFVLIRSNGAPTYNLSVVVDDVESRMTHIVRGDDHINNTPKQIHLYNYFKYPVPLFAHLPMILGPDKQKLSKRHGAVSANVYRGEGYLPEALLNFLARLGWSHGDQEIFSVKEMIEMFGFDKVQKSSAVFNTEKLLWTNGMHIRAASPERLVAIVAQDYADFFTPSALERARTQLGARICALIQPKVKLVRELAEQMVPLCTPGAIEFDRAAGLKWDKDPSLKAPIQAGVKQLISEWEKKVSNLVTSDQRADRAGDEAAWGKSASLADAGVSHTDVDASLRQICEQFGVKLGDFTQPIRLVLTGKLVSAGLFDLLSILPWDVVGPRLQKVLTGF